MINAPKEIFEMLKIRGLGIKKIKQIYLEAKIETIRELEEACLNKKLLDVKGISEKFCNDVLKEIDRLKRDRNKLLLSKAEKIADSFITKFKEKFIDIEILQTGELRRSCEVIGLIDFITMVKNKDNFLTEFSKYYNVIDKENKDNYTQLIINYDNKANIYLYVVDNKIDLTKVNFYKTGSEPFLNKLIKDKSVLDFTSEEAIFNSLGINYIEAENREYEALEYLNKLSFNNNLKLSDIKSLIHFHTTWSDGLGTIEEMAENAIELGLDYFVVSDHSKTPVYANGLNENRVYAQKEEINVLRKDKKLNIFHGIESDILPDGNLDYDEEILKTFDFVIASVHNKFDMTKDEMTSRIIKAIENPYTDAIGHVSGRILLRRNPYELDIYKILDACAINDVAIEINSSPSRLDLDWRFIFYARNKGVKFCINPDAHSVSEIEMIKYGIKVAKKGGVSKEEVINCLTIDKFIEYINRKVNRKITWSENGIERVD